MKIVKVREVKTPTRGTGKSAGLDFYIPDDFPGSHFLAPGQDVNIPSGIHVQVPTGMALVAMNRTSVALNKRLQVGACVVDEDYQGEIHLHVTNIGMDIQELVPGEKLVQMILIPVQYCEVEVVGALGELYPEASERGNGAFGSTGNGVTELKLF